MKDRVKIFAFIYISKRISSFAFLAKYEPSDIMSNSCVTHGSVPK